MLILSVTTADVSKAQVTRNNDELMNEVIQKTSILEEKIDLMEANMPANPSDLQLQLLLAEKQLLLAEKERLNKLEQRFNLLYQQQQQQGDLT